VTEYCTCCPRVGITLAANECVISQDDDSNAMLPPIHKTNLQIDVNQGTAPKKNNMLHKAAAKPAAALMNQKGGSHKGMTNRRNKKEDPMQGLSVYNSKGGQGGAR